jgi:salicylate hydroxylase
VDVIVAGGGTGGLAAAIALRRLGADVIVLEQAPAFSAIGAGLGLQVNATRALTHVGGDRYWRETSSRIDAEHSLGLESGSLIAAVENAAQVAKYGEHYRCGHRADLMQSLLEPLPEDSVRVASRVVALEETPTEVRVVLETGEELRADLLIGADGLRSTVRTLLFGEQEARFTGVVVWRGLIPTERIPERHRGLLLSWLGRRRHVLVYPIRRDSHPQAVTSLSAFVPVEEVQRESWTVSGDLEDLRASLEGACSDLAELLAMMDSALITGIYFRDPLEEWGTERAILLGDAAHPAPPSAGQGAGMALEDAVTLAACVDRHGPQDLPAALREYVARRRPRTTRMLESSRVNLTYSQVSEPAAIAARDGYYRGLRRLSPLGAPMREWLLGHDPVAAAQSVGFGEHAESSLQRMPARRAYDAWRGALSIENRAVGWTGERAGYEEFMRRECPPAPEAVTAAEPVDCDGVLGLMVGASGSGGPLVLHLHGGAYVMGSAASSIGLAARLAAASGGSVLVPEYRLAPEHAFPAALEDAIASYRWLRAAHPQARVLVSGECAGGGLALALVLSLRDGGEPLPEAIYVCSPFCDLSVSGAGFDFDGSHDPWFDWVFATQLAACYVQESDPSLAPLSPLFADLRGLPPTLIHAAAEEAMLPSARLLAERAQECGVQARLEIFDDSVHSFVLFDYLPETAAALRDFAALAAPLGAEH